MNENRSSQRRLHFDEEDDITYLREESERRESEPIDLGRTTNLSDNHHIIEPEIKIPMIGMEFDTEDLAYQFYNDYAYAKGFSIRRSSVHKDRIGNILDRKFCCSCEGLKVEDKRDMNVKCPRPETRNFCRAQMKISIRNSSKYKVVKYVAEHDGHILVTPTKSHFLRSHRNISAQQAIQIEDIEKSGIPPKAGLEYMTHQVGGRDKVGFILEDLKHFLHSKRKKEMNEGEAGGVLNYLQMKQSKDPNFFYAVQVDEDDLIANIFWTDGQMKVDYEFFGDVLSFDTTYRTNKEERPIALFVGINHHKQTIVFGAALLYDETTESFMWLFDTFAKAMNNKKPATILTDQDAAIAKALEERWPETCHRLCIWHIYQNAAMNLNGIFSAFTDFAKDFNSCIYDYEEEEEFLTAWQDMLEKYGLRDNEWLENLYRKKEKWAMVYGRQAFCANMISTQRSESMNSALKRYVSSKHHLLRFFQHFDRLVEDRRYQEMKADLRTCHSTQRPAFQVEILKHATTIYTHEIFKLFQEELSRGYDSRLEIITESEDIFQYKVTPFGKQCHHTVNFDALNNKVSCSCKKFEFAGILCSHALKVLTTKNIAQIPEFYIKKRWTKKAKKRVFIDSPEPFSMSNQATMSTKEEDEKRRIREHYRELGRLVNQLVIRAASTDQTFEIARTSLLKMIEEVDSALEHGTTENTVVRQGLGPNEVVKKTFVGKATKTQSGICEPSPSIEPALNQVRSSEIRIQGWKPKQRSKIKSGKRMKNGLEQAIGKRRRPKHNKFSANESSSVDVLQNDAHNRRTCGENSNSNVLLQSAPCLLVPSLSHLSQNYEVETSNWSGQQILGTPYHANNQTNSSVPTTETIQNYGVGNSNWDARAHFGTPYPTDNRVFSRIPMPQMVSNPSVNQQLVMSNSNTYQQLMNGLNAQQLKSNQNAYHQLMINQSANQQLNCWPHYARRDEDSSSSLTKLKGQMSDQQEVGRFASQVSLRQTQLQVASNKDGIDSATFSLSNSKSQ